MERVVRDKDEQMNGAIESFGRLKSKLDNDYMQLRQKYEQLYLRS